MFGWKDRARHAEHQVGALLDRVAALQSDLAAERDRYERLVETMTGLKRSGFEPAVPLPPTPEAAPELPAVVRTAILDRAGADGGFLEAYARQRLAEEMDPAEVAREIYEGGEP